MREITQVLIAVYFLCNHIYANESGVPCGQEELIQCSKQIRALAATSEFNFVDNKEELERVCPDLHMGLECIKSYTRRCMNLHQREHFNKLYYGTNEMIKDLCMEGQYQEDFLRHAPCMRKVKTEYDQCTSSYQHTMANLNAKKSVEITTTTTTTISPTFMQMSLMKRQQQNLVYLSLKTTSAPTVKNSTDSAADQGELQIKTVCCAFQKYMECSENAVAKACGYESAEFTRNFLDKMLSSLMRLHCEEPERRRCEEYSSSTSEIISFRMHLMLLSCVIVVAPLII